MVTLGIKIVTGNVLLLCAIICMHSHCYCNDSLLLNPFSRKQKLNCVPLLLPNFLTNSSFVIKSLKEDDKFIFKRDDKFIFM